MTTITRGDILFNEIDIQAETLQTLMLSSKNIEFIILYLDYSYNCKMVGIPVSSSLEKFYEEALLAEKGKDSEEKETGRFNQRRKYSHIRHEKESRDPIVG